MTAQRKSARPLSQWAFARLWCVIALPWLLGAAGWAGYTSLFFERVVFRQLAPAQGLAWLETSRRQAQVEGVVDTDRKSVV